MSDKSRSQINRQFNYPLLIGFLTGVIVASTVSLWVRAPAQHSTTDSTITGDFEVEYMFETTGSEASGSKIAAASIQFYDNYVVVTDKRGNMYLWATSRLRKFKALNVADPGQYSPGNR